MKIKTYIIKAYVRDIECRNLSLGTVNINPDNKMPFFCYKYLSNYGAMSFKYFLNYDRK